MRKIRENCIYFICRKENTLLGRVSNFQKYASIREPRVILAMHAGRLHSLVSVKLSWAIEVVASMLKPVLIEQANKLLMTPFSSKKKKLKIKRKSQRKLFF